MDEGARLRIGELSRRVGVTPELLRAWENRYALVRPERTPGGLRLYSEGDVRRVQRMRKGISRGLSAAESARLATGAEEEEPLDTASLATALLESLGRLDEPAAQAALDRIFRRLPVTVALSGVVLPVLRRVGEQWAVAEFTVAQEHFASQVLGGRLRALGRGWGEGTGPHAILACPPGERHELGLIAFGLSLRERRWRITYLGADTPMPDAEAVLDDVPADALVLSAVVPERFDDAAADVRRLAERVRVVIGGAGSSPAVAAALGAEALPGDVVAAAALLALR